MAAYSNERVAAIILSVLYRILTFIYTSVPNDRDTIMWNIYII